MKEKNRIIIPTGHEPEEELESPHFDAEETLLSARPVIPLTKEAIEVAQSSRAELEAMPPTRRIPILALIIIAAVSVGLASGLAIGLYEGRQQTATPVAAERTSTTTVDTQFKQKPAGETTKPQLPSVQTVADTEQRPTGPTALSQPEGDPMVEGSPETSSNPEASDEPQPERRAAPDKKSGDEKQSPPPAPARKKPQTVRDDDDGGGKKLKLPRRRPAVEQDPYDVPRTVERANRELNRIRDIFEGPRP